MCVCGPYKLSSASFRCSCSHLPHFLYAYFIGCDHYGKYTSADVYTVYHYVFFRSGEGLEGGFSFPRLSFSWRFLACSFQRVINRV